MTTAATNLKYLRGLAERLKAEREGKCQAASCRTEGTKENPLQWAHREPTGLKGEGRGWYRRLRDVRDYPEKYLLLCRACHLDFDAGRVEVLEVVEYVYEEGPA